MGACGWKGADRGGIGRVVDEGGEADRRTGE